MATAEERLRIIVEAQDKASQALRGVERQTDSLMQGMRLLQSVMTFSLAGIGIRELGRFTVEMARLGAQTERIENAFAGLSEQRLGTEAMDSITKLREASRGAISDYDLMLAANKAMMLGVTADVDTMARLVEVAIERGRAMGVGAQQAFGDIVTGIGRISPKILDNIGILTESNTTYAEYAEQLGKTADALSDVEKRQALVNKVLKEGGAPAPPDAMEGFEALDAQLDNWKRRWSELFTDVFGQGAQDIAAWLLRMHAGQSVLGQYTDMLQQLKASMPGDEYRELRVETYALNRAYEAGQLSLKEFEDALKRLYGPMMDNEVVTRAMVSRYVALEGAARGAASGVRELTAAELARAISAGRQAGYGIVGGRYPGQEGALRSQTASDALDLRLAEAEALGRVTDAQFAYQLSTRDTAGQVELLRQKLAGVEEGSVEYYEILTRIQNLQNSMAKGGAKLYDQRAAELRSLAESLLRPTDVSYMDMAQTRLGTYTDKWDEYARRVRAAGNDVKSQWRNLVPLDILAQGEDAIKAWAAAEEEAFYAGQRPDQMNWDAFLENARREVEKQISRENMVNEAMQRLAEAGIGGLSRADVAKQFGVVDTTAVGSDTAAQVVQGMTTVDAGKQFTDAFNAQFRAQETRWIEFGSLSVTWFSAGVQNGVASGAADTLVDALVPRIQEKLGGRP